MRFKIKRATRLTVIAVLFHFANTANAQVNVNLKSPELIKTDSLKKDSVYHAQFNKRAEGFYAEGLGPGGVYSLNYDRRFSKKQNGLGGRIGISYVIIDDERAITFPAVVNYLFGKKGYYLEIGAGATYYRYHSDYYGTFFKKRRDLNYQDIMSDDFDPTFNDGPTNENGVIFSVNIGFRYQALKEGGLIIRVGMSPVFNGQRAIPYWPYAGFGFKFGGGHKKTKKVN